jgi:hypothetical protein
MITPRRNPWSKDQIRAARRIELAPLLQQRGFVLLDRGGGNIEIEQYKGLILKASYWNWPDRDLAGNAIDFYVKVLGLSFSETMKELTETHEAIAIRSERGYSATKYDGSPATDRKTIRRQFGEIYDVN